MTDRAQQAADAIDAVASLTPLEARRVLNEFTKSDLIAAIATGHGGSNPFRIVTMDVAYNTPGLVVPASGPAGIHIADVAEFEMLMSIGADVLMNIWVFEAWDGARPTLYLTNTAGRGNLPGTPPSPFNNVGELNVADSDDSGTGVFRSNLNLDVETTYFTPATSIYAYVADADTGNDPGSSQGSGRLVLVFMNPNA